MSTTAPLTPKPNVLVFAASLRKESVNHKLAALAARVAQRTGARRRPRVAGWVSLKTRLASVPE
jgi:hypothetical protein